MAEFGDKVLLGRTGRKAGRLGISSSYGAPAAAFEEAFDRGCNYFNWGTFIKGRSSAMKDAIQSINRRGHREDLIISMLTYAHHAGLTNFFFKKGLKSLGIEYADILLLGWFPAIPQQKILDGASELREKGLIKHIGITSHNRKLFPKLDKQGFFDVYHVRYNAAHRGAEEDVFPYLNQENKTGIVNFTATCWGKLLDRKKMPAYEKPPTAPECYRFALSNPFVDVCMTGARDLQEMRENLSVLDSGPMVKEEMKRMKLIGSHVYGKKK